MDSNIFYTTENDWGQMAILPIENEIFIKEGLAKFAEEYLQQSVHTEWDDVFFRKNPRIPLKIKKIKLEDLEETADGQLEKFEKVVCTNKDGQEEIKHCFAYKFNDFVVFYGQLDGENIEELSIDVNFEKIKEDKYLEEFIEKLGETFHLILVDWAHEFIIHLNKPEEFKVYLDKMSELYN